MILWFRIRNVSLVFIPSSGTELINPWHFLSSEGQRSLAVSPRSLGKAPRYRRVGSCLQGSPPACAGRAGTFCSVPPAPPVAHMLELGAEPLQRVEDATFSNHEKFPVLLIIKYVQTEMRSHSAFLLVKMKINTSMANGNTTYIQNEALLRVTGSTKYYPSSSIEEIHKRKCMKPGPPRQTVPWSVSLARTGGEEGEGRWARPHTRAGRLRWVAEVYMQTQSIYSVLSDEKASVGISSFV